ncbi:MAG: AraC-like DNA-binding protein [Paraglaciecola sp.]|jgi:AraC-like DNA-binding protein
MTDYFSVLSGWLIPIRRAMDEWEIDFDSALASCGIKTSDFKDQESRLSAERVARLIEYSNNLKARNDFAITIAKNFHPGTFHALGYAMMTSNTLYDAFKRIAQYKKVVSNTCKFRIEEHADVCKLILTPYVYESTNRSVLSYNSIITFIATLIQFSREASSHNFRPLEVNFNWSNTELDFQFLNAFFACPVNFDKEEISFICDTTILKQPLLGGNPLLTQSHERMLDEYLLRLDKNDVVQIVKNNIYEMLSLGTPTQTDVAKKIGMSLRNLQRKLNEQDACYRDLLEETRKKLALEYITQGHLSLSEIGYLVGFANIGNFNRAFKRWTNFAPGEYRKDKHLA